MIIEPTEYKTATTKNKQRIHAFKGFNPIDGVPSIIWDESFVTYDPVADRVIVTDVGSCSVSLTDPLKPLVLRNPADDTVIGQAQYQDVFVMLYSLGRQTQIERDEALIAARNAPVVEEPV